MMDEQNHFDLALKTIMGQASAAERAEVEALLASNPEFKRDFDLMKQDVSLAKATLPLIEATASAKPREFPAYARERLQSKISQTLRNPHKQAPHKSNVWHSLRWLLSAAAAVSVVLIVAIPTIRQENTELLEVGVMDSTGTLRGTATDETAVLKSAFNQAKLLSFIKVDEMDRWQTNWLAGSKIQFKVFYDRSAGEIRVYSWRQNTVATNIFTVEKELIDVLPRVRAFISNASLKN